MSNKLDFRTKRYLSSRFGNVLRETIAQRLVSKMNDGDKPRWSDLHDAIDEVFAELRAMPFDPPDKNSELERESLEDYKKGNFKEGEDYLNETRTSISRELQD